MENSKYANKNKLLCTGSDYSLPFNQCGRKKALSLTDVLRIASDSSISIHQARYQTLSREASARSGHRKPSSITLSQCFYRKAGRSQGEHIFSNRS